MTVSPYDFRTPTPLPVELTRQLDFWFADAARRAAKAWGKVLRSPPELRPKAHELVAPEDCPAYIPGEALAFRILLGPRGATSLVVLPRPLVLVLLGGALG